MNVSDIESFISARIGSHITVRFSLNAAKDFSEFDSHNQKRIIALIIKRGQHDPRIPPCKSLSGPLNGFAKIKFGEVGVRIIYRPKEANGQIRMEIIAIGPRSDKEAYEIAAKRLTVFKSEMSKR